MIKTTALPILQAFVFGLLLCVGMNAWAAQVEHLSLNGEWQFAYTPSTTNAIPIPPAVEAYVSTIKIPGWWDEQLDRMRKAPWFAGATFRDTQGTVKYLAGTGWHRRIFKAPESWRDRAVTLTVGRSVSIVHVFLNGRHLASYDYGVYTPLEVDLTGRLEYGKPNELVIAVDNNNTRSFVGGWSYLGNQGQASGITEPVSIDVAAGAGRVANLFIQPGQDLTEVEWNAELQVPPGAVASAPSKLVWEVWDADKKKKLGEGNVDVPAFEKTNHLTWRANVTALQPWSDRHPNLYWTRLRWVSSSGQPQDELEQRFGLRRFTLDGRKLLLNGKPIYLRGSFGNFYFPLTGTPPTDKEYWRHHMRRLKNIGINYMNFAAEVCPRGMLEAADEEGMIMQCGDEETALEAYKQYYEGVWNPILRWTRNNPSMCIYGFGGEHDYYEGAIEQFQRQHDLIKQLNPGALVMPQQAIRGIDYGFDARGAKELTEKPFPHHQERLDHYTEACDLFGHYSGGSLSYNYDQGATWRGMDERFKLYSKPLSAHELFMGASYTNPKNAARYTGRIAPYLYDDTRKHLEAAGILDRWPVYFRNSVHLQSICAKYNLEKVRKCHELAGFELLGAFDMQFMPYYTVGFLDEFLDFKPGNNADTYRRFNAENILLIDYDRGVSINRAYYEGETFKANAILSLYGEDDLAGATFGWSLSQDGKVVREGAFPVNKITTGKVDTLGKIELIWPVVNETTKFKLTFTLKGNLAPIRNDWDFWVFPKRPQPVVRAAADDACFKTLAARFPDLTPITKTSTGGLHIISRLTPKEVKHLNDGGDILLLGTQPFPINEGYASFRSGLGGRPQHNIGTVLAKHPIFADLPNEGWADWEFYYVLHGASPFILDDTAMGGFSPILEIISSESHVRKQAAIFERRVGKGRLFVSSCVYNSGNPACMALLDGIMRYVTSDKFQPKVTMELDRDILTDFAAEPPARDPNNRVPESTFDRRSDVLSTWRAEGVGYNLERHVVHSGRGSLRLQITPEQLKKNSAVSAGASTIIPISLAASTFINGFDKPEPLRFAVWCRAEQVTAPAERDFLIYIILNYADGTHETVRLPLPGGTHDWQSVETAWYPKKKLDPDQAPIMYIAMSHGTGTAWLDDLYVGPTAKKN